MYSFVELSLHEIKEKSYSKASFPASMKSSLYIAGDGPSNMFHDQQEHIDKSLVSVNIVRLTLSNSQLLTYHTSYTVSGCTLGVPVGRNLGAWRVI